MYMYTGTRIIYISKCEKGKLKISFINFALRETLNIERYSAGNTTNAV